MGPGCEELNLLVEVVRGSCGVVQAKAGQRLQSLDRLAVVVRGVSSTQRRYEGLQGLLKLVRQQP